jgi:hypothetical protein
MERGGLLAFTAVLASCASAPEVVGTKLEDTSGSSAAGALAGSEIAKKKALSALLPNEVYPHEGRQFDVSDSHVRCVEVDVKELEQGRGVVLEGIAAETCVRAAEVFCTGAPTIIGQQVDGSVMGAGKVQTDCVQETPAGRKFGTLFCKAEAGVYDEVDGQAGAVCVSISLSSK